MNIDTTSMCSHLQEKLFEEEGEYHRLWMAMQDDPELTAVVRSRQLHIYRNGKKVLVLAGKSVPKSSEKTDFVRCYLKLKQPRPKRHDFSNRIHRSVCLELQAELKAAAQNKEAVRHSEAFRRAYHPHYRIVAQ